MYFTYKSNGHAALRTVSVKKYTGSYPFRTGDDTCDSLVVLSLASFHLSVVGDYNYGSRLDLFGSGGFEILRTIRAGELDVPAVVDDNRVVGPIETQGVILWFLGPADHDPMVPDPIRTQQVGSGTSELHIPAAVDDNLIVCPIETQGVILWFPGPADHDPMTPAPIRTQQIRPRCL